MNDAREKLFVGIDNGKHGAIAIIDINRNIKEIVKYAEKEPTAFYKMLKGYSEDYDLYAFIEKPIVVYGLSHQTAPFETIGRHKMTLEILNIPYKMGDPAATSSTNWKKILGALFEKANAASKQNTKEISVLNRRAKELVVQAEYLECGKEDLAKGKIAYMNKELATIATEYREIKKKVAKLKGEKKEDVKQVSIDSCLSLFPKAENYIAKSKRAVKNKYDNDMAEALLLAECGRVIFINGEF